MIFYALLIILLNLKGPKLTCLYALKCPTGLERQATDDGTRCGLAPEGGAVNTP